ncbi:hypothetical protein [Amycolatopsis samaneae]|uniref:Uncharacterized protein n=1 Tax=Amycolatopsis samaneae TaxID=664691 RepID=A0ABW5G8X5_9PSEU
MSAGTSSPTRQRWLIPVLVVVASLTVGVGLLAREVYSHPDAVPAGASAGTVSPVSSTPLRPDQEPGPDAVDLSPDAAAHPSQDAVRKTLQTYFSAINERDHTKWGTSVTRTLFFEKPPAEWQDAFSTTKDGSIRVYRIEQGSTVTTLRALVGFTSTQSLDYAPNDAKATCLRWRMVMPLVRETTGYKVDKGSQNESPINEKC